MSDTPSKSGYGNPPQSSRFKKGQSGNPRGRPRKSKLPAFKLSDQPLGQFFEAEAYRTHMITEKGKLVARPASQLVIQSMINNAIKGNRLQAQFVLRYLEMLERNAFEQKAAIFDRICAMKADGEAALARAQRRGEPEPEILPHPKDIILEYGDLTYQIEGPFDAVSLSVQLIYQQSRRTILGIAERVARRERERDQAIQLSLKLGAAACLVDGLCALRYRWGAAKSNSMMDDLMFWRALTVHEIDMALSEQLAATRQQSAALPLKPGRREELAEELAAIDRLLPGEDDGRALRGGARLVRGA